MTAWRTTVFEAVRLAVAVLLYVRINPALTPIFTWLPIAGEVVAALIAATLVLVATWVVLPCGRVVVELVRYSNGVPLAGPSVDLKAPSNSQAAEMYGLQVRFEYLGLFGRYLGTRIAKKGLRVAFVVNTDLVVMHSESDGADEESIDRGLVLTLNAPIPRNSWSYATVSVDTREMPSELGVDVDTRLIYPGDGPWYRFVLSSTSNVKKINLVNSKVKP